MTLSITPQTCSVEPFRYQATPQPIGDQGASSNQINEQALEDYLARLRTSICDDLQAIIDQATAGVGVTRFTELADVPSSYTGSSGLAVAVKNDETGLEFVPFPDIPPPPTYFLTPRLICMYPPSVTTAFGPALTTAGAGQIQIPVNPANTLASNYRQGWSAAAAANSVGGGRLNVFQCIRGSASPLGGFRLRWRFGLDLYAAGARCWVGVFGTNAFPGGATEPSAAVNCIWLGFDSTDTLWQVMHNDAAGGCTKVPLTGFTIAANDFYEVTFDCASAGDCTYVVRNLVTGTEASGTLNSNLPAGTAPLIPVAQIGSAATGVQCRISHVFMSLEVGPGE